MLYPDRVQGGEMIGGEADTIWQQLLLEDFPSLPPSPPFFLSLFIVLAWSMDGLFFFFPGG